MLSLQLTAFGKPNEVVKLIELAEPASPGPDEVLVAVDYAPINPAELLMIRGFYGVKPPLPAALGAEGVGHVLQIGSGVDQLKVGDRVLIPPGANSWRERLLLKAAGLKALPPQADPQQLAMLSINPPTAALLLSEYVDLQPGEWVLQNAGNSGVGRAVIAIARARGFKTVSLVRRPELVYELKAAGGDVVLLDGPQAAGQIAEAIGQATLRLALDGVGGDSTMTLMTALGARGTLVFYSGMSGKPGQVSSRLVIFKDIQVKGFWLGHPHHFTPAKLAAALELGADLIARGQLHASVSAVYPLSDANQAIEHAIQGGKVLFKPT